MQKIKNGSRFLDRKDVILLVSKNPPFRMTLTHPSQGVAETGSAFSGARKEVRPWQEGVNLNTGDLMMG